VTTHKKKSRGNGGNGKRTHKKIDATSEEMISNLKELKAKSPKKIVGTKKSSDTFWTEFKSTFVAPNPPKPPRGRVSFSYIYLIHFRQRN
jgi:hypothetical protein